MSTVSLITKTTGDTVASKEYVDPYIKIGNQLFINHLIDSTSLKYNLFIGKNAGNDNSNSEGVANLYNTYIGHSTGKNSISGKNNTGIGYNALQNNKYGDRCTVVGSEAYQYHIAGNYNTIMGFESGLLDRYGVRNTFVGYKSGQYNTIGTDNTFFGYKAGQNIAPPSGDITAYSDVGSGQIQVTSASHGLTNGMTINIMGSGEWEDHTFGNNYDGEYTISNVSTNTFEITASYIQESELLDFGWWGINSQAKGNTCIGTNAGDGINKGSYNTIIGYYADVDNPDGNQQLNIANQIKGNLTELSLLVNGTEGIKITENSVVSDSLIVARSGIKLGDSSAIAISSDGDTLATMPSMRAYVDANGGGTETDPVYTSSQAANITATDITNLGNLSGTNTGDQDLSVYATQSALEDTASALRTYVDNSGGTGDVTAGIQSAGQVAYWSGVKEIKGTDQLEFDASNVIMTLSNFSNQMLLSDDYFEFKTGGSTYMKILPSQNNVADNIVYDLGTSQSLTADGIKLLSLKNNGTEKFSVDKDGVVSGKGIMQVAQAEILYSNTTQTAIVSLPVNAVVWGLGLRVETGFDDSGTDNIEVGITGNSSFFLNESCSGAGYFKGTGTPNELSTLSAMPYRISTATDATFKYVGQNSDATQGQAFIYVHYTLH